MLLFDQLKALESKGEIINVGLVGGGFMGRGIVEVLEFAPGMRVAGVC
ncbi:MAG: NAD(P)-dependent oxidoreductase, partial [Spirochaetes bacterium]